MIESIRDCGASQTAVGRRRIKSLLISGFCLGSLAGSAWAAEVEWNGDLFTTKYKGATVEGQKGTQELTFSPQGLDAGGFRP